MPGTGLMTYSNRSRRCKTVVPVMSRPTQQFVVHARDERGDGVSDYVIEVQP
jgi:hypothetical protein